MCGCVGFRDFAVNFGILNVYLTVPEQTHRTLEKTVKLKGSKMVDEEVGGAVTWDPPADVSLVTHFAAHLAGRESYPDVS